MSEATNPYIGPAAPRTAWTISGVDPVLLVGLSAPAMLAAAVAPTQEQARAIAAACRGMDARQAVHALAGDPAVDKLAVLGWARSNVDLVLGAGETLAVVTPNHTSLLTAADLATPDGRI